MNKQKIFKYEVLYEFQHEIEPVNLSSIIREIEEELREHNAGEWYFEWDSRRNLVKEFEKIFDEMDFWNILYGFQSRVFSCGCLTLEPWNELDEGEEYILNTLLHEQTELFVDDDGDIKIRFYADKGTTLHPFFQRYRHGYGENISSSYKCMLRAALRAWKKEIDKDLESDYGNRLGEWKQEEWAAEEE